MARFPISLALLLLLMANLPISLVSSQCAHFQENSGTVICSGGTQVNVPDSEESRGFQTPRRGEPGHYQTYQDMSDLVGYASVTYSASRTAATVEVRTFFSGNQTLTYYFGGNPGSQSNVLQVASNFTGHLAIAVSSDKGFRLELDPVGFVWIHARPDLPGGYEGGQRGGIVELFGWPYADIAQECEVIGRAGYLGVKVFPPSEHVLSDIWLQNGELNPWYFIYQPVSYRLSSRSGSRAELVQMIATCRSHGVRVYADAVVNHMSGGGNDIIEHCNGNVFWGAKESSAGSPYFTHPFTYQRSQNTDLPPGNEFPAVPYGPLDFHCERTLGSWNDPFQLNYGWLVGLADLNSERPYVQERIASYFVDLLGAGFSGFRIDAAKHISPDALADILRIFRQKMGGTFPEDFVTWLEVIIGGEKDLLCCQYNSYNWYAYFTDALKARGFSDADILKIKIWSSDYPKEFPICGSWIIPSERFAIQNDDHDQQNDGSSSRDMGDKGSILIKEKNADKHRGFEEQLFRRTDGNWKLKMVLSSYTFMNDGAAGYPDGWSDCSRVGNPVRFLFGSYCKCFLLSFFLLFFENRLAARLFPRPPPMIPACAATPWMAGLGESTPGFTATSGSSTR